MGLSRRQFVGGMVAGMAAIVAVPYSIYKFKTGSGTEVIEAILKRRVGYLKIPSDVFQAFASDYLEFRKSHKASLAKLSVLALPLKYFTPYDVLNRDHPLVRLEDNVVSNFLLSTDFFHFDMDETRTINYRGFYDPVTSPCTNPFFMPAGSNES